MEKDPNDPGHAPMNWRDLALAAAAVLACWLVVIGAADVLQLIGRILEAS
jgi:hypothetical protein